jgi:hypothetical protein
MHWWGWLIIGVIVFITFALYYCCALAGKDDEMWGCK